MSHSIPFRAGDEEALAEEFIRLAKERHVKFDAVRLEDPGILADEDILAVHYADAGAQGDAGAVEILYRSPGGLQVLYGNYVYDDLDLNAVIQKLPMLGCLDCRRPYPYGGQLDIPPDWGYLYMGAMNHFYARDTICERTGVFIRIIQQKYYRSRIFDAVAWFCGVETVS